jgi:hypothetical protein
VTKKTVSILSEAGDVLATESAVVGPDSITIKRLGWRRLEEAQRAQAKDAVSNIREMGGPAFVKELQSSISEAGGRDGIEAAAAKDPLSGYDKHTLISLGAVRINDAGATTEALDDLEPETATAVAREVLRLSRPALFETEAERKNG